MRDLPSDQQPWSVLLGRICPYCGQGTEVCDSSVIYGRSYGTIHLCRPCQAWVGTHKNAQKNSLTSKALGRLANAELRRLKQDAHASFDRLWDSSESRRESYNLLAAALGIHPDRTHIGMFNADQCRKTIQYCDEVVTSRDAMLQQWMDGPMDADSAPTA